jgi:hypothetical protein
MQNSMSWRVVAGGLALAWLSVGVAEAQTPDKAAFVAKAKGAYYSFKREGVSGFKCTTTPDWQVTLADDIAKDPSAAAVIPILQQLRYVTTFASDGSVKVERTEPAAPNAQMKQGFDQIYSGLQQSLSGFFATWRLYVVENPLPDPGSQFQMEPAGGQYRLTWGDGGASVTGLFGRDYAIGDLRVVTSAFDTDIKSTFTPTPKGLLLNGYRGTYRSAKPEDASDLNVVIAYQEVGGAQIPRQLDINGTNGTTPFKMRLTFSECEVTRGS